MAGWLPEWKVKCSKRLQPLSFPIDGGVVICGW